MRERALTRAVRARARLLSRALPPRANSSQAVDDATKKRGYRLVGDADYAMCKEAASKITPVPGGVGPMTIAMLLKNVLDGAARAYGVDLD